MFEAVSPVFTSKNINETAWYGWTRSNSEAYDFLISKGQLGHSATLRELIDVAYAVLLHHRRDEYVFKNILLSKTVFGKYSPNTTAWIPEFAIANARADAVLINGCATVFEIKTGLDDFSRLNDQLNEYYKCFSRVVVLVDLKHVEKAELQVPPFTGICTLTRAGTIRSIREPVFSSSFLSSSAIFQLLRKTEYESLARRNGLEPSSLPQMERFQIIGDRLSRIPPLQMHNELVSFLRSRGSAAALVSIAKQIPAALMSALYEYRVRKSDWMRLISRLDCPLIEQAEQA